MSQEREQRIEAALLLMDSEMIKIGKDLIVLKLLKGPGSMTQLNISEFHAYALIDAAMYYLHARHQSPEFPLKDLLLFMDKYGLFDRVGDLKIAEVRNAIPDELRKELEQEISRYRRTKEISDDQRS